MSEINRWRAYAFSIVRLDILRETDWQVCEVVVDRLGFTTILGQSDGHLLTDLEEAIMLDSTNAKYRYKYGNVLIGVLDLAGAKYNFEYAIKRDSMLAEAYVGLGRVYALIDNPGMATAGSGDVITGIITGLIAQGLDPLKAAVTAVYLHGLTGDKVATEKGEYGLLAGDIVERLPYTIKDIVEERISI